MEISCDFCGRTATVIDTADAQEDGWYTHSISTNYATVSEWWKMDPVDIIAASSVPQSLGFICPSCGDAMPRDEDG